MLGQPFFPITEERIKWTEEHIVFQSSNTKRRGCCLFWLNIHDVAYLILEIYWIKRLRDRKTNEL